jgi:uncharacterized protein (UPF0276 family)
MKLAINYSDAAESLVEKGKIKIDLFKCPDWPWLVKKATQLLPATVHFDLQIGNRNLPYTDWQIVNQLFENTHTLYINLHLEPERKNHTDIPTDSDDQIDEDKLLERIRREIQPLLERYSAEQIILENVRYRGARSKVLKLGVLPKVIKRILNEIGCGLLLDISHARISANHLGIDEREYISNLPVEKLRELHFTGLHEINGKLVDHLPILAEDWPILEWVIAQINSGNFSRPWLLAFEYGGVGERFADRSDPNVIAAQVPLLADLINSV